MTIETLIVFGDHDRIIFVETAEILKSLLPYSTVILLKNVGHVAMFENHWNVLIIIFYFKSLRLIHNFN
jgi:pimeloyl-ACP methyl ester carboxylesterase